MLPVCMPAHMSNMSVLYALVLSTRQPWWSSALLKQGRVWGIFWDVVVRHVYRSQWLSQLVVLLIEHFKDDETSSQHAQGVSPSQHPGVDLQPCCCAVGAMLEQGGAAGHLERCP